MLVIEIILTVVAWFRGWNRYAVVPMAAAFSACVLGEALFGSDPAAILSGFGFGIVLDCFAVAGLIGMIVIGRDKAPASA